VSHGSDGRPGNRLPTVAVAAPGMLIAEALARALRDADLHVVIADADLRASPDGAPDLIPQLVAAGPGSRFVIVAAEVDGTLAREVAMHGVHAVVLKSSSIADVIGTLQNVARGRTSFPAAVLERLSERPDARGLSSRQLEVLEELALGRSNDEIARNLFISTNTVKFHLRAIYEPLDVRNRVEAAQLIATRGGLEPPFRAIPTAEPRA
jgi:DNA-binding NarL/FixJ family response regulator